MRTCRKRLLVLLGLTAVLHAGRCSRPTGISCECDGPTELHELSLIKGCPWLDRLRRRADPELLGALPEAAVILSKPECLQHRDCTAGHFCSWAWCDSGEKKTSMRQMGGEPEADGSSSKTSLRQMGGEPEADGRTERLASLAESHL